MSNIVIFKSGEETRYLKSANTTEHLTQIPSNKNDAQQFAKPGVIINPDLSAVEGVELKFWKRSGNTVVEMTQAEKQAVLDAEEAQKAASRDNFEGIDVKVLAKALVKAGLITKVNLKSAIQEVLNG